MTNHSPHQSEYYAFGGKLNPLHRTTSLARTKSIDVSLLDVYAANLIANSVFCCSLN